MLFFLFVSVCFITWKSWNETYDNTVYENHDRMKCSHLKQRYVTDMSLINHPKLSMKTPMHNCPTKIIGWYWLDFNMARAIFIHFHGIWKSYFSGISWLGKKNWIGLPWFTSSPRDRAWLWVFLVPCELTVRRIHECHLVSKWHCGYNNDIYSKKYFQDFPPIISWARSAGKKNNTFWNFYHRWPGSVSEHSVDVQTNPLEPHVLQSCSEANGLKFWRW